MRIFLAILILIQAPLAMASEVRAYIDHPSIWSPTTIYVDGEPSHRHFFEGFSDLPEAMRSNPEAAAFAERAKNQAVWGNVFIFGGLAAALTYLVAKGGGANSGTYWGLFLVGFLPGVFIESASRVSLNKAINAYNSVDTKSSSLLPNQLFVAPVTGGGIAGLSWSF